MKKLVTLVLILSLGLFCTIGCGDSGAKKSPGTGTPDGKAPPGYKGAGHDEPPPAAPAAPKK